MPSYQTGLLIIRAWVEKASSKPLRTHLRMTTDVSRGFDSQISFSDATSTTAAVEDWLKDVLEQAEAEMTAEETQSPTTESAP
jgi:hypothetical protein